MPEECKKDLQWVYAVLKSSCVRVDQMELHTRLAACVEKIEKVLKEAQTCEIDNQPE